MDNKFNRERWHYPVLDRYTYLDTATTGLIPQYACDAMNTYLQNRTDLAMDIDDYHWQWEKAGMKLHLDRIRPHCSTSSVMG